MTEKKRPLLDEMARIRAEREKSEQPGDSVSGPEPDTQQTPDSDSPPKNNESASSPEEHPPTPTQSYRPNRSATPVEHAKAYADLKKAQLKKQRKSRWFRFFNSKD